MPKRIEHKFIKDIEYKWCGGECKEWHTLDKFGPSKNWDGLRNVCTQSRKVKPKDVVSKFKIVDGVDYKYCEKHKEWHNLKEFGKNSRSKLHKGYRASCRKKKVARGNHTIIDGVEGKVCTADCKLWKNFKDNNFKKSGKYKDGSNCYSSSCKDCINTNARKSYKIKGGNKMSLDELKQKKIEKSKRTRIQIIKKDEIEGKICSNIYHKKWVPLTGFVKQKNNKYVDKTDKYGSNCNECRKINRKIMTRRRAVIKELYFNINEKEFLKTYIRPKTKNGNKCVKHNKYTHLCYECYPYEYRKYYDMIKNKRKTDPIFRLKDNLRHRINSALKNNSKSANTETLLGCTVEELWTHLEFQFTDGMTRDNYGEWAIDHIKPCAAFGLSDPREQRRCFSYRNLQPMWGSDNSSKGDKYKFNIVKEIELWNIK